MNNLRRKFWSLWFEIHNCDLIIAERVSLAQSFIEFFWLKFIRLFSRFLLHVEYGENISQRDIIF